MQASISLSAPSPVKPDSGRMVAPFTLDRRRSVSSTSFLKRPVSPATRSHLLTPTTSARPSFSITERIAISCFSKGMVASSNNTTTSANLTARSPSETAIFSSLSSIRERLRMPAVSKSFIGRPRKFHSTPIESRVIPASGPTNSRSSPSRWLISVDLPAFGRPTMAMRKGRAGSFSASSS